MDSFATGKPDGFYILPIAEIEKIIMDAFHAAFSDGVRPISPESTHAAVSPDSVRRYCDRWDFGADIAD